MNLRLVIPKALLQSKVKTQFESNLLSKISTMAEGHSTFVSPFG